MFDVGLIVLREAVVYFRREVGAALEPGEEGKREEVTAQSSVAIPEGFRSQQPQPAEATQKDSFTVVKQPESKEAATTKRVFGLLAQLIAA